MIEKLLLAVCIGSAASRKLICKSAKNASEKYECDNIVHTSTLAFINTQIYSTLFEYIPEVKKKMKNKACNISSNRRKYLQFSAGLSESR
jgi:hypothetical protein